MRHLLCICAIAIGISSCGTAPKDCEIENVSIFYDNGNILHIVALKTNDVIRKHQIDSVNFINTFVVQDEDSLLLYQALIKSMRVDSLHYIPTVISPTISSFGEEGYFSYYDDSNDINADIMLVYKYKESHCTNDTLFLSHSDKYQFRLNNFKASGDSILWKKVIDAIHYVKKNE